MAFLTPDKIVTVPLAGGTITIKQKIIPDGARTTKNICKYIRAGDLVKPNAKLNGGTGIPKGITVHNTENIKTASGTNPAEQYTRGTYPNGNMGGVVVTYFVWHVEIWQQLKDCERGWHAADGCTRRASQRVGEIIGGNLDTISIECIGADAESVDTTAKLVTYLLHKYGLKPETDVYTHKYFFPRKYCPAYILPKWSAFMALVKKYYEASANSVAELEAPAQAAPDTESIIKLGNAVTFTGAVNYVSATAETSVPCKSGRARVTQVAMGKKHPYHLKAVAGSGSNVYGWVDATDITPDAPQAVPGAQIGIIKVGSTVKLNIGAKTYTGGNIAAFTYARNHVVKEIKGDRVVITYGGVVIAAVKLDDLTLIKA